jgi:hypothetical protein
MIVNVRRTATTFLATALAASLPLLAPSLALTQDSTPQDAGNAPGSYAAENYAYAPYGYPRWTINYGPFRCTRGYSYYRPLQPNDWGYGPHGPHNNLNASQKSPSGMTWW